MQPAGRVGSEMVLNAHIRLSSRLVLRWLAEVNLMMVPREAYLACNFRFSVRIIFREYTWNHALLEDGLLQPCRMEQIVACLGFRLYPKL